MVDEDSFKHIFSQFFPQGGEYKIYYCVTKNRYFKTALI